MPDHEAFNPCRRPARGESTGRRFCRQRQQDDRRRRAHWLSGVKLTIRHAAAPKCVRLTCHDDGSDIEVVITARGRGRCTVAVDHTKLANAQLVVERRHCWKEMLAALKHYLERPA